MLDKFRKIIEMLPEDQLPSDKKIIIMEILGSTNTMNANMPEKVKKMVSIYNKLSEEEKAMFCKAIDHEMDIKMD
jgi:hypothetical protein